MSLLPFTYMRYLLVVLFVLHFPLTFLLILRSLMHVPFPTYILIIAAVVIIVHHPRPTRPTRPTLLSPTYTHILHFLAFISNACRHSSPPDRPRNHVIFLPQNFHKTPRLPEYLFQCNISFFYFILSCAPPPETFHNRFFHMYKKPKSIILILKEMKTLYHQLVAQADLGRV